jgi:hypothetical protein
MLRWPKRALSTYGMPGMAGITGYHWNGKEKNSFLQLVHKVLDPESTMTKKE